MVALATVRGFLLQDDDRLVRRLRPEAGPIEAIRNEIVRVDLAQPLLQSAHDPPCSSEGRRNGKAGDELLWLPSDPSVPLADLHDRTPKCGDSDHWVAGRSAI